MSTGAIAQPEHGSCVHRTFRLERRRRRPYLLYSMLYLSLSRAFSSSVKGFVGFVADLALELPSVAPTAPSSPPGAPTGSLSPYMSSAPLRARLQVGPEKR